MAFQMSDWCQKKFHDEIAAATPSEKAIYVRDLKIYRRNRIWQTLTITELAWMIEQYEKSMAESTAAPAGPIMAGDVDVSAVL